MYRVSVCYPGGEGSTFDMEYYKTKHKEIVLRTLKGVERFDIDQGVDGPYMAVGHLIFPSLEAMQAAMSAPEAAEAQEDVKNFTNVTPAFQVSQIIE